MVAQRHDVPKDGPSVHEQRTPPPHDRWAREAFTFRRMETWQIWSFAIALVLLAVIVALFITG